jgi:pyrroloquinoline quinone biosynthesis protein E
VSSVKQKRAAAAIVRELGFAFTVNVVLHRANLDRIGEIIDLAASLGADRLELANTQYYGWGLENRAALMPTRDQVDGFEVQSASRQKRWRATGMQMLFVLPDYFEQYPKPCYGGWGKVYVVMAPDGKALPCHGATNITTLPSRTPRTTRWSGSGRVAGFNAFRGDAWMKEPVPRLRTKVHRLRRLPLPGVRAHG